MTAISILLRYTVVLTVLLKAWAITSSYNTAFLSPQKRTTTTPTRSLVHEASNRLSDSSLFLSDWSSFTALEDDDDDELLDTTDYAREEDSQQVKAQVGAGIAAPTIERPAEPICVPPGSQLELDEETVLGVLSACREELGTLFGYSAENRGVGITGGMDFVELDGPTVVIKLKGRYWHQRTTVLERVANYLQQRIPEIVEVTVEDPYQLTDEANEEW